MCFSLSPPLISTDILIDACMGYVLILQGDMVFVHNMSNEPFREGEVVLFKVDGFEHPIVHRVIKVTASPASSISCYTPIKSLKVHMLYFVCLENNRLKLFSLGLRASRYRRNPNTHQRRQQFSGWPISLCERAALASTAWHYWTGCRVRGGLSSLIMRLLSNLDVY